MSPPVEPRDSLWWLAASPTVWAAHFLASYVTVAVWCEKVAGPAGPLGAARMAVVAYTALALAVVGAIGLRGWRHHRYGPPAAPPHDEDTAEDRHRFLGLATVLLSALSAVAIAWVALPAAFVSTCR